MKVTICLAVIALIVCIETLPSQGVAVGRTKRGFRMGAADRFSHGFGKRGDESLNTLFGEDEESVVMTAENLADILKSDPRLLLAFVKRYIDTNDDDMISQQELFEAKK